MAVLDLWTGQMSELPEADTHIKTSAALPADLQAPKVIAIQFGVFSDCLLYTSPSPRDRQKSRMPSSA